MHIRLTGPNLPQPLLEVLEAVSDHARLEISSLCYKAADHQLVFRLRRYPLRKHRRALGNLHAWNSPISCDVTIRNVLACNVTNLLDPGQGEAQLVFGIKLTESALYLSSPEDDHGKTLFAVEAQLDGIDLEMNDVGSAGGLQNDDGGA